MAMTDGFCADGYAIGIDMAKPGSRDEGCVAIVKLGEAGKVDVLVASLTWEQAKLVARAVAKSEES
jgi:hypothetical protein